MLAADVSTGEGPSDTLALATSVLSHDNKANLQVKILPHNRFKLGEAMKIQVHSDRNGYLLLFDINSAGKLTRLFPNKFSQRINGYVKKNQTITIPNRYYDFEFVAEEPLGSGLLIALLVEDELSAIQKLLPSAFIQVQAKNAQLMLQQLRQQLNQTLEQKNKANRPVNWSMVVVKYEIIKRNHQKGETSLH
jgi:hypothetical protein